MVVDEKYTNVETGNGQFRKRTKKNIKQQDLPTIQMASQDDI